MSRELSPDEVSSLGLERPAGRELSDDEVKRLGLDEPAADEGHAGAASAVGAMTGANLLPLSWLGGAAETLKSDVTGTHSELSQSEKFQRGAESWREVQRRAGKYNPKAYYGSALAAGVLAPTPGGSETAAARIGGGAVQGAFQGAGEAKTLADVPGNALMGASLGGLVAGVGEGIGAGLSKLRGAASGLARNAEANAAQQQFGLAAKKVGSEGGALGGVVAAIRNQLTVWREALTSATATAAQKAEAAAKLASPEAAQMERVVFQHALDEPKLAGYAPAKEALRVAREGLQPAAIETAASESLANPIRKQIVPRVVRYAAPVVGGYLGRKAGEAAGHPDIGMAVGALAGGIAGGHPGTALSNAARNPAVRKMVGGVGTALVRESAPTVARQLGQSLAPMSARSEELRKLLRELSAPKEGP